MSLTQRFVKSSDELSEDIQIINLYAMGPNSAGPSASKRFHGVFFYVSMLMH